MFTTKTLPEITLTTPDGRTLLLHKSITLLALDCSNDSGNNSNSNSSRSSSSDIYARTIPFPIPTITTRRNPKPNPNSNKDHQAPDPQPKSASASRLRSLTALHQYTSQKRTQYSDAQRKAGTESAKQRGSLDEYLETSVGWRGNCSRSRSSRSSRRDRARDLFRFNVDGLPRKVKGWSWRGVDCVVSAAARVRGGKKKWKRGGEYVEDHDDEEGEGILKYQKGFQARGDDWDWRYRREESDDDEEEDDDDDAYAAFPSERLYGAATRSSSGRTITTTLDHTPRDPNTHRDPFFTLSRVPWQAKRGALSRRTAEACLATQNDGNVYCPYDGFHLPLLSHHYMIEARFETLARQKDIALHRVQNFTIAEKWRCLYTDAEQAFVREKEDFWNEVFWEGFREPGRELVFEDPDARGYDDGDDGDDGDENGEGWER